MRPAKVGDRSTLLNEASAMGQSIFRHVAALENAADSDELHVSLTGSPLHPSWINESDSLLFYTIQKKACLYGCAIGHGFIISRLPSPHPSLIRWSAPAFVSIKLTSLGLSLGSHTVRSFTACLASDLRLMLTQQGRRSVAGLEAAASFGGLQHKADLIEAPTSSMRTVGINHTSSALLDLSYSWGGLQVDAAKNSLAYGPDVTVLQILHGGVEAPREMQPLYGILNAVVSTVERVTPPARVSASLERMTAGFDPDRRMVLPNGSVVVREDLREAPKDK